MNICRTQLLTNLFEEKSFVNIYICVIRNTNNILYFEIFPNSIIYDTRLCEFITVFRILYIYNMVYSNTLHMLYIYVCDT